MEFWKYAPESPAPYLSNQTLIMELLGRNSAEGIMAIYQLILK